MIAVPIFIYRIIFHCPHSIKWILYFELRLITAGKMQKKLPEEIVFMCRDQLFMYLLTLKTNDMTENLETIWRRQSVTGIVWYVIYHLDTIHSYWAFWSKMCCIDFVLLLDAQHQEQVGNTSTIGRLLAIRKSDLAKDSSALPE